MVNWKEADSQERLLAAVVGSYLPNKPNYHEVAKLYGRGATYNAVETKFRSIRKMAEQLVEGGKNGGSSGSEGTPTKAKKATNGKKKGATQGVISGRVTKSKANGTKTSRKAKKSDNVKLEGLDSDEEADQALEDQMNMDYNNAVSDYSGTGDGVVGGSSMGEEE